MTRHAQDRARQRNIGDLTIRLLREYGAKLPGPGGAKIRMLSKADRKHLLKELKLAEKNLSARVPPYIVESSDGEVITAGRRWKRIRR